MQTISCPMDKQQKISTAGTSKQRKGNFSCGGNFTVGGRGNGMSKKFPVEGFAPWVNYPKVAKVALIII
jgi:hypothetical protein